MTKKINFLVYVIPLKPVTVALCYISQDAKSFKALYINSNCAKLGCARGVGLENLHGFFPNRNNSVNFWIENNNTMEGEGGFFPNSYILCSFCGFT